jgi:DNA-binding YbaB/EbfC family protein
MGNNFKMPDMGGLMAAAQKMQKDMARVQEELASKTVEAAAGGGMVTCTVNGAMQVDRVKIDASVVDPKDIGMLEDLIVAAINQGLTKAKDLANAEMSKVAGGMNIPGLPGLF